MKIIAILVLAAAASMPALVGLLAFAYVRRCVQAGAHFERFRRSHSEGVWICRSDEPFRFWGYMWTIGAVGVLCVGMSVWWFARLVLPLAGLLS